MTKWELVRNFVNTHDIFTKTDMRKNLNIRSTSNYTESQYVSHMLKVGFLKRSGRGSYERVCKIPENMSTNQIINLVSNKEKREKLMTILFRKEKLKALQLINNSLK